MSIWVFNQPPAVFIRIRKTGSTSIVRGIFKGRGSPRDIEDDVFPPAWRSRFVFAFVRNPFDRLVSSLQMFREYPTKTEADKTLKARLDLHDLMDIVEDDSIPIVGQTYVSKLRQHIIPMTHPSYFLQEAEFIGRFEQFEKDCRQLYSRLNLEQPGCIPHLRSTPARDYRDFFDKVSRARAEQVFAEDMERCGYSF